MYWERNGDDIPLKHLQMFSSTAAYMKLALSTAESGQLQE